MINSFLGAPRAERWQQAGAGCDWHGVSGGHLGFRFHPHRPRQKKKCSNPMNNLSWLKIMGRELLRLHPGQMKCF